MPHGSAFDSYSYFRGQSLWFCSIFPIFSLTFKYFRFDFIQNRLSRILKMSIELLLCSLSLSHRFLSCAYHSSERLIFRFPITSKNILARFQTLLIRLCSPTQLKCRMHFSPRFQNRIVSSVYEKRKNSEKIKTTPMP